MRVIVPLLALSLAATACAHTREHDVRVEETVVETAAPAVEPTTAPSEAPTAMPRPYPRAAAARMNAFGKRDVAQKDLVTVPQPDGGLAYRALFAFLSEQAGIRVRYEERNATIKGKKLTWMGDATVPRADLIAWAQDAMFYDGLVLVAQGPADRNEYIAMDLASPYVSTRPTFVREDQLPALEGRVGLYVSCILTVPDGIDASRVRQALSQLSTRTAGLGRVNDVGKSTNTVFVSDFASVVATMRRALDEMETTLYESSAQ